MLVTIGAILISMVTGFQKEITLQKNATILPVKAVMAKSLKDNGDRALFVQYESKGNNVFVECIVTGVTFREMDENNQKTGKMIIWIDGKKSKEVSTAAFIIKDLKSGSHKLKLEVVDLHNKPYGLTKEFKVNIPNN
jgi:hypothetical protein